MSFPPAFHTPRLSFAPINADIHAEAVFEMRGREDVMKYSINHAPDPSVAATHAFLSNFNHFEHPGPDCTDLSTISPIGYVISELPPPSGSPSAEPSPATGTVNGTITNSAPTIDSPANQGQQGQQGQKAQPKIIGMTGLRLRAPLSAPSDPLKRWEVGYVFHPSVWGRGLATETVRGWIRMVREELVDGVGLGGASSSGSSSGSGSLSGSDSGNGDGKGEGQIRRVLAACTDARNEASMRVLEKCGFVMVGEFKDEEGRGNCEFEVAF